MDRPGERRLDDVGGVDEGYATALCIADPQRGWLPGVRGAAPPSHTAVKGLLPWQPQSNSLANITVGLEREQGADFDISHQVTGVLLTSAGMMRCLWTRTQEVC